MLAEWSLAENVRAGATVVSAVVAAWALCKVYKQDRRQNVFRQQQLAAQQEFERQLQDRQEAFEVNQLDKFMEFHRQIQRDQQTMEKGGLKITIRKTRQKTDRGLFLESVNLVCAKEGAQPLTLQDLFVKADNGSKQCISLLKQLPVTLEGHGGSTTIVIPTPLISGKCSHKERPIQFVLRDSLGGEHEIDVNCAYDTFI
ncbi:MAG: hypothetical protein ABFD92_07785 [Planctomycetaceae bacterium]|nr:hypothetical protein [Planctomycetaceae bacterium]